MSGSEWGSDGKAGELSDPGVGPLDRFPAQPLGGRRGKSVSCGSTQDHLGLGGCLDGKYSHLLSQLSPCLVHRWDTEAQ